MVCSGKKFSLVGGMEDLGAEVLDLRPGFSASWPRGLGQIFSHFPVSPTCEMGLMVPVLPLLHIH